MSISDIVRFIVFEPLIIVLLYLSLAYLFLKLVFYYLLKSIAFVTKKLLKHAESNRANNK